MRTLQRWLNFVTNPPATSEKPVPATNPRTDEAPPHKIDSEKSRSDAVIKGPVNPEQVATDSSEPTSAPAESSKDEETPASTEPAWPALSKDHPLSKFMIALLEILTTSCITKCMELP